MILYQFLIRKLQNLGGGLAVEAGFYRDVVESRTFNSADRVRSPVGEKCDLDFFSFPITFGGQCGGGSLGA